MSETVTEEIKEVDVLEPKVTVKYREIGIGEDKLSYEQKPLSFFGKMELFSLFGDTIDKAMREGDLSLFDLFDLQEDQETIDSDVFVRAIAKLLKYAPEFLKDLYCVALAIPKGEREYAKILMEDPGLDEDIALDILDTFIEQNWDAVNDFLMQKLIPMFTRILSKGRASELSKPLNPTRPRTRKQ